MLVRSAGRRQRRQTSRLIAASFAQLNLPWLAPAQLRWSTSQAARAPSSESIPPRRKDATRLSRSKSQWRALATAAEQHAPKYESSIPPNAYGNAFRNSAQDKHIPWDVGRPPTSASIPATSYLRPLQQPIIINTTTQSPSALIKVYNGLSGTGKELLAHLHTSLSVGRRDRAKAIIQRLAEECEPGSPEMSYAHNAFLRDLFKDMSVLERSDPSMNRALVDMQKWFEKEVRDKGVLPSVETLTVMLRAAIRAFTGAQCDRTIRRYLDIARQLGNEILDDVLDSPEYDDHELHMVERVAFGLYGSGQGGQMSATSDSAAVAQAQAEIVPVSVNIADIPEVRSTDQRGPGLDTIKRTMDLFTELPALPATASLEARTMRAFERQKRLEEASVDIAIDRWRKADEDLRKIGIHTAMQSKPVGALMWQWYQALMPALEQELKAVRKALSSSGPGDLDRKTYGPYFELLSLDKMAASTILFTLAKISRGKDRQTGHYELEIRLNALTTGLGKLIEQEAEAAASIHENARKPAALHKPRKQMQRTKRESKSSLKSGYQNKPRDTRKATALAQPEWPLAVRVKLGAVLVSKLIETAQLPVTREHPRTRKSITQMQPAFMHRVKYQRGKKLGMVMPNGALIEKLQSEPVPSLIAKRMPMIVEPVAWKGWSEGGYLHYPNPILRLPLGDKTGKDYFLAADARKDLDTVYNGLTALSQVPWKVNTDVFAVQLEAWNSGEAIANFAPLHLPQELPKEPDTTADPNARRKWLAEMRDLKNKAAGLHSKRCFQNFQLEIARTVLNETLYFPHNMDFRGRAYPIPPYLNHMGADNVRGLLTFARGKELGPEGLRWLKIHVATVAGHDKASMEERIEFTMFHLDDIRDSVEHPLDGRRWWLKAEDAWQTLAACFELVKALDSPDHEKYVSYLPIQQDGTCNGLQHYAALGGDKVGAAQVNLEPGDRPADVYTAVAEAVKEEVRKDAEAGNRVALKLHGRITRKCVKQPVMTNVYGVTFYGAKAQVQRQLEVLFPEVTRFDEVNLPIMAQYIAKKIFRSLGTMFSGAQAIQNWLGQCADRISTSLSPEQIAQILASNSTKQAGTTTKVVKKGRKSTSGEEQGRSITPDSDHVKLSKPLFKSSVVWTTPLRLPVVQPYRTSKTRTISTTLQNLSIQEPQVWDPVSKRKQLQAFPPNFIHSLDATHMLLSALECTTRDMTFASIHDSFWTHACDVNTMSTVLRDQFVAMHSEDVIGRLREEFVTRYQDRMYLTSVPIDSPVGQEIVQFRKRSQKKKLSSLAELKLERQRMMLLNSDDLEERIKGKEMTTAGSILLDAGESALGLPAEMAGQTLGDIPNTAADTMDSKTDEEVEATNSDADEAGLQADPTLAAGEMPQEIDEASASVDGDGDTTGTESSAPLTSKKSPQRKLYVWLPLTFPPVPKKGDFDVTRLRHSKYFFH